MTRLFALLTVAVFVLPWATPAAAQDQTLADIRQELSVLYVEVQRLKRELSTTGAPTTSVGGNSPLERIDAIEQELQRLTSKTEQLQFRVDSVVSDGSNRIGDLEFRLCELESDCDISQLGETTTLGGGDPATTPAVPIPVATETELAVGEQVDFDNAQAALADGDFQAAADAFAVFTETYPGGPLSAEAHFLRGEALEQLGDTRPAARAYLDSFSSAPTGPQAPNALFKVGTSLAALGQMAEACQMLEQVEVRFPEADVTLDARSSMLSLGCL